MPDHAEDRTDSLWARIERAREHLESFNAGLRAWFDQNQPSLDQRFINEYTEAFTVGSVASPPLRLSVIAGDFLHSIRSALDNLAFATLDRSQWATVRCPGASDQVPDLHDP